MPRKKRKSIFNFSILSKQNDTIIEDSIPFPYNDFKILIDRVEDSLREKITNLIPELDTGLDFYSLISMANAIIDLNHNNYDNLINLFEEYKINYPNDYIEQLKHDTDIDEINHHVNLLDPKNYLEETKILQNRIIDKNLLQEKVSEIKKTWNISSDWDSMKVIALQKVINMVDSNPQKEHIFSRIQSMIHNVKIIDLSQITDDLIKESSPTPLMMGNTAKMYTNYNDIVSEVVSPLLRTVDQVILGTSRESQNIPTPINAIEEIAKKVSESSQKEIDQVSKKMEKEFESQLESIKQEVASNLNTATLSEEHKTLLDQLSSITMEQKLSNLK